MGFSSGSSSSARAVQQMQCVLRVGSLTKHAEGEAAATFSAAALVQRLQCIADLNKWFV
jgi:hypothetical protein